MLRLGPDLISDTGQPLLSPFGLDLFEALTVYSWRALVGLRQIVGIDQNVLAIDLVIEQIEALFRLFLGLPIQLL